MNIKRALFLATLVSFATSLCAVVPALGQVNSQTEPPKVIRKSGGVFQSSAITRVEPTYPPLAKAARVSGAVVVEVTVDEQGDVLTVQAISGHPLLKDSAIAAARGWKFSPTQLSGVPVKVIGTITFNFSLGKEPPNTVSGVTLDKKPVLDDIEEAKKALNANSYSPEAHFKLADAYSDEDMYDEAIEPYKRAIELKPGYKKAYLGLASAYKELGKRDEEIATYKQAVQALPNDVELLTALERSLFDTERYLEAADIQKSVVRIKPDDPDSHMRLGWDLFKARRYQDAIAPYREAARLRPKDALAYHNIGAVYLNLRQYEDAIVAYTQALNAQPDYNQTYKIRREMGEAYLYSGRSSEAVVELKRSVELNPGFASAHRDLAAAYHQLRRYEEAIDAISKAIELEPKSASAHNQIGHMYQHINRVADAEREFREAIKFDPESPQFYIELAAVFYTQKKLDEAENALRPALQRMAQNVSAHAVLASLLSHLGQEAEAESALKKGLQVDPNNAMALNNLGYMLVERGERLEEALVMIQRAVKAQPKNPAFLDSLGWAYFKLGKLDEAERYLSDAIQIAPSSTTIHEHLGDINDRQGKAEQARASWAKALFYSTSAEVSARLRVKMSRDSKK